MKTYLYLYLLFFFNPLSASEFKVLSFPVSTSINKAKLSDFSIQTILSSKNVTLDYNESKENFDDVNIVITNTSNIPIDELGDYQYNYTITELSSECQDYEGTVSVSDFARIFINDYEYFQDDVTENIAFEYENSQGYRQGEDILVIRTDEKKVSKDLPVSCSGLVSFNVELIL